MVAMDIHAALDRFLRQLRADGRSPHTVAQYKRHVLLLARWLDAAGLPARVEEIGHEEVARFLGSRSARTGAGGAPRRASTLNALRSSLKGFFGYLHRAGYTVEDASRLVRRANCADPPPRPVWESDQERLFEVLAQAEGQAAERDHALFRFLAGTGCRVSAALALDVGDVDLERGEVLVRFTKGSRPQRLFLSPGLQEHLRGYIGERRTGVLFPGAKGRRITSRHAHRRFQMWLERAGVEDALPHGLRHAFAMGLYQRTRDVLLVQRALGHRSIASTLRYAQAQDEELRLVIAHYGAGPRRTPSAVS